mmetsp:Transcript_85147/g.237653  ORF Transcript_85147/g.237653 Transcript_85147/m.237653 type:complete len:234 (-) Transcript_85147:1542-2243(-)
MTERSSVTERLGAPCSTSGQSAPKSSRNTMLGEYQQANWKIHLIHASTALNLRPGCPNFAQATLRGKTPTVASSAQTRRHSVVFPAPCGPTTAVAPGAARLRMSGSIATAWTPLVLEEAADLPSCASRWRRRDVDASAKSLMPSRAVDVDAVSQFAGRAISSSTSSQGCSGKARNPGVAAQSRGSAPSSAPVRPPASLAGLATPTRKPLLKEDVDMRMKGGTRAAPKSPPSSP